MQRHFYRLDCWDQLEASPSNRISPLPGLSSSLFRCFPLQSCPLYKQTVFPYVVLFEPHDKFGYIQLQKNREASSHAGLFKVTQEPLPLSKEFPSHLHAWIKNNSVQPSKTNPILPWADVLVSCRFLCAIVTLSCVVTSGWAHDAFTMIIMPSTY